jgi:peroxiredoxin Q/BCP
MRTRPSVSLAATLPLLAALACGGAPPPASTTPSTNAVVTGAASSSPAATPAAPGAIAIDAVPPDFAATASDGTPVQLSALKGKPVVVYFYPKDETPGCTTEACSFRDAWTSLAKKGVVLIGVSADTDESHRAFAQNHKLPFLLVSDSNGAIARQFGVPVHDGIIARQSFVIGADGKMKKIYRTVDVTAHAAQIAADVQ